MVIEIRNPGDGRVSWSKVFSLLLIFLLVLSTGAAAKDRKKKKDGKMDNTKGKIILAGKAMKFGKTGICGLRNGRQCQIGPGRLVGKFQCGEQALFQYARLRRHR